MANYHSPKRVKRPRIELTDQDLAYLSNDAANQSVPALVKRTGLSYMLIYNIVHGRVRSVSEHHYRILFGKAPPPYEPKKVDGAFFRRLVGLWLFLSGNATKSDLYREFYGKKDPQKVDYRIFTGHTQTVEPKLVRVIWKKFSDAGLDQETVERWIEEMDAMGHQSRIPYDQVRPVLIFLQNFLGVHPTTVLNQSFERYETGKLQSVSPAVYNHALELKEKTREAIKSGLRLEIEKLKEEISGGKPHYILYAEVEEELRFLRKYAKKSAKKYLGRSTWTYEKGMSKRIAYWRAANILADCDRFIRATPQLPVFSLPRAHRIKWLGVLLSVLVARTARLLSQQEGIVFEKRILTPLCARDEYKKQYHGFTRFDLAPNTLRMHKKAFDLMVAKNCEIFKSVGKYADRWYLSDLYLRELSENAFFELITAKYEMMAKEINRLMQINECMH